MRLRGVRPVTRARAIAALAALACIATFVACTLNPQPLPPSDFNGESAGDSDAGSKADSSGFGATPEGPAEDAGTTTPTADSDGGDEGGDRADGGDGGDAGDGSTDASDDGG